MKKLIKPLKYLGSAVLLFIGLLYLINLIPTKLDPRVAEIEKQDLKALYDKNKVLPEFIQFLEKSDLKSNEDLKIFGKMLETNSYPLELRFPQIVKLGTFARWNDSYLSYLKTRPENERYQGLVHAMNFIEKGIRNPDSLIQSMFMLSALKSTVLSIPDQKLSSAHLKSLQAQIFRMIEDRTSLVKTTLDSEFKLQVYFIMGTETDSWGLMEDPPWVKALSFLWKPFLNANATANEALLASDGYKKAAECLETWSCEPWQGQSEFHVWKHPRNPIGKTLLQLVNPSIQSRLQNIQRNWQIIENSTRQAQIEAPAGRL